MKLINFMLVYEFWFLGAKFLKNIYLRDWLLTSWTLLAELVEVVESLKVKASKEALLRYGRKEMEPGQPEGRARFPLTKRTLYKILKCEDTSRLYKESTINELNKFFETEINRYRKKLNEIEAKLPKNWHNLKIEEIGKIILLPEHWCDSKSKKSTKDLIKLFNENWSSWEPLKVLESDYQPEEADFLVSIELNLDSEDTIYCYKCSGCSSVWLSKNINESNRFGLKSYTVSCDVYKKVSPAEGKSISISLCETCFIENKKLLTTPWTVKIRVLKHRLQLPQKELAKHLAVSESTISRLISVRGRKNKNYKYISSTLGRKVLSHLIVSNKDSPFEMHVKRSFAKAMERQFGLTSHEPAEETKEMMDCMKDLGCTFRFPFAWGAWRNASVVFFVEEDPSTSDYLEFIKKASKLKARYLILVEMPSYIKYWHLFYNPKSKSGLDCDLPQNLRILCHDLRYYPSSPCNLPQGPSPIKFRRLSDKSDPYYQALDKKIIEYINAENNKLLAPEKKAKKIKWLSSLSRLSSFKSIAWEAVQDWELVYYELELASMFINRPSKSVKLNVDLANYSKRLLELARYENRTKNNQLGYHQLRETIQIIDS